MVEDCLVNSFASRQHWPLYSYFVFILGTCKCTSASFDTTLLQECDLTTRRSQLVTTHLHTALPTWNQNDSHFFLQNPVLQTGRWSWLLAPSDVATPLRLPHTSPLPLLSLLHLLLHHCECFLERVTGGVGQSRNWSRGDWVWVILIVEPIWKWYAWCVFCAGAHGVWYSWYSTALCPLKQWFLLNFDFGTCEEPTVNRPKGIQKTHANYL